MNSMTGYGKGIAEAGDKKITIEIKAVNNRFLEINCRLPKVFAPLEVSLKKRIQSGVKRGSLEIYGAYEDKSGAETKVSVDVGLAGEYLSAARELSEKLGVPNDVTASFLMKTPDVVRQEASEPDTELIGELLMKAADAALAALNEMRGKEGENLAAALGALGGNIAAGLEKVRALVPLSQAAYREKLATRIKDALDGVNYDETRFLNEIAFFCDKADITEETERLGSHLKQYNALLLGSGEAGKQLDFLSQEMNREINTIGSKAQSIEISELVLSMKNELEKIKEQIRNIE